MDVDIKWMMEGEVETVVTEDADEEIVWDRVERALAFLDTGSAILLDGTIKAKVFRKDTHTQTSTSTSIATALWSTREGWYEPCCTKLRPL